MEMQALSDSDLEAMLGTSLAAEVGIDMTGAFDEEDHAMALVPGAEPDASANGVTGGSGALMCAALPSIQSKCELDVEFDLEDGIIEIITGYCLVAPIFIVAALVIVFLLLDLVETLFASNMLHEAMPCICLIMAVACCYGFYVAVCECLEIKHQQCTIKSNHIFIKTGWRKKQEFQIAFDQLQDVKIVGENLVLETKWNLDILLRCVRYHDDVREFILTRKDQTCCFECCHQVRKQLFNEAA